MKSIFIGLFVASVLALFGGGFATSTVHAKPCPEPCIVKRPTPPPPPPIIYPCDVDPLIYQCDPDQGGF